MAGDTVITIVGNLTADPEFRTIQSGSQVASFTIASTPRSFNRNTNQWEDGQALFMRCSAWRDMASHCANSLTKGMRVIAQGRLQQRNYQAQDGSNRSVMEMQVDEIGPSLKYATAQVARQQSGQGGFQPGQAQGAGFSDANPFGGAQPQQPQQVPGVSGSFAASPNYGAQQQASQAQPPVADPWADASQGAGNAFGQPPINEPEF